MIAAKASLRTPLDDGLGRRISYVRLSLTDRCDLRCRYCMADDMVFLPKAEILTIEEIVALAHRFVDRGVSRIRLTGGEPLVRNGAMEAVRGIAARLDSGLQEITLTTNGTRLSEFAAPLVDAGVRRINISLDTRDADRFRHITRHGDLSRVLDGIDAADRVGLSLKINMVALNGLNDHEILPMLEWCAARGFGLTLIETMPLGMIEDDRTDRFYPLTAAFDTIADRYAVEPSLHRTGGPARYWTVPELGIQLGLISPLTQNFCEACNRIRVSASGQLYMCLGHDDRVDLRAALRGDDDLDDAIDRALRQKPARHQFDLAKPATKRHMSVTGG
jgi:GTP 3',8-cyclase